MFLASSSQRERGDVTGPKNNLTFLKSLSLFRFQFLLCDMKRLMAQLALRSLPTLTFYDFTKIILIKKSLNPFGCFACSARIVNAGDKTMHNHPGLCTHVSYKERIKLSITQPPIFLASLTTLEKYLQYLQSTAYKVTHLFLCYNRLFLNSTDLICILKE